MLKSFKEQEFLVMFQEILGEKYEFGNDTILNDITNGMNILIIELFDLIKIADCLKLESVKVDRIVEHNRDVLCKYCANFENSKFEILQKLFDITSLELNKLISDKMTIIDTILYLLIQTDIKETNYLFNHTKDKLEKINQELLEETIGVSTEEYTDNVLSEIGTIDKNRNYFMELIQYINVNLERS